MSLPPPSERQARLIWAAATGLAGMVIVALVVLLIWGLGRVLNVLAPVLWPLAVAGIIAYLLDPVVDFLEGRGTPRARAILIVFALGMVLVLWLAASIVPQAVRETRDLIERVPAYAQRIEDRVQAWMEAPPPSLRRLMGLEEPASTNAPAKGTNAPVAGTNTLIATHAAVEGAAPADTNRAAVVPPTTNAAPAVASTNAPTEAASAEGEGLEHWWRKALNLDNLQTATGFLAKAAAVVGSWFLGQLGRIASWFGVLAGLALIPIYAFYFLLEKQGIESKWTDYLPVSRSEFKTELVFVIKSINDYLIAFFRGQLLVAICDGIMYTIGFSLIGLPYALLIGVMATFLTIIPFVGAIITCGGALLVAVVQYGDWLHPLMTLGVYAIVQMLEGYVIQPKILGDRVGLHPLTIIIAVMAGTTLLGGILGGILAIPFTAALRVIMFRYVWHRPPPGKNDKGPSAGPPPEKSDVPAPAS